MRCVKLITLDVTPAWLSFIDCPSLFSFGGYDCQNGKSPPKMVMTYARMDMNVFICFLLFPQILFFNDGQLKKLLV